MKSLTQCAAIIFSIFVATGCSTDASQSNQKSKMLGGDRDKYGCIPSAGYKWCQQSNRCERPWELIKEKQLNNTIEAFNQYCQGESE